MRGIFAQQTSLSQFSFERMIDALNDKLSAEKKSYLSRVYQALLKACLICFFTLRIALRFFDFQTLAILATASLPILVASSCFFICSSRTNQESAKKRRYAFLIVIVSSGIFLTLSTNFKFYLFKQFCLQTSLLW